LSRLKLPHVVLCAATGVAVSETLRSMERCLDQVEFGSALLLTDQEPVITHPEISWRRIAAIWSREAYSEFVLRELARHVDLPHALVVQWDGFVVDASRWRDEFLDYDYIGATWPQFDDEHNVGNGGFSLRSKRLLDFTASAEFPGHHPEDVSICRTYRALLERKGLRFAPAEVAGRFSFERGAPTESFGFHGLFNFPRVLPAAELNRVLKHLDPGLLSNRDGADFILQLAERGDLAQAWRLALSRHSNQAVSASFRFWRGLLAATVAGPRRASGQS
jgi:hypothetical protein